MDENAVIYLLDNAEVAKRIEEVLPLTAPHYQEKYKIAKAGNEAIQEAAAGWLLLRYLGVNQDEQLQFDRFGKPELVGRDLFFSLSHCEKYTVLAVSSHSLWVWILNRFRKSAGARLSMFFLKKNWSTCDGFHMGKIKRFLRSAGLGMKRH